ncbi:hypothetical protein EGW08_014801 [Elysia chlorotica]|uniref:Uncharacterized protein n=1 Tax=Elysia chlorotica TaxID=188477 RepID=A0A3S1B882_ELYCH|nr:hypothetical protein EGW08_014801 [Elysia chlorotica]
MNSNYNYCSGTNRHGDVIGSSGGVLGFDSIYQKAPQSALHRAVVCSNLRGPVTDANSQKCNPDDVPTKACQGTAICHGYSRFGLDGHVAAPKPVTNQGESSNICVGDISSCTQYRPTFLGKSNSHQINPRDSSLQRPKTTPPTSSPNRPKSLNNGGPEVEKAVYLQESGPPTVTIASESMGEPANMSGLATYTPPMSPLCGRVLTSPLSPAPMPGHLGSSASLFSLSPHDAAQLVRLVKAQDDPHDHSDQSESRHCYFIHLKLRTVFSEDAIPGACVRKLPRLLNGIPLGAGFLSSDQLSEIRWRLVEGEHSTLTFLSCPLLRDEAEESRTSFRDRLITQAQAVFGDVTVRASLSLSRCIDLQEDLVLNDIATNVGDGLQFKD